MIQVCKKSKKIKIDFVIICIRLNSVLVTCFFFCHGYCVKILSQLWFNKIKSHLRHRKKGIQQIYFIVQEMNSRSWKTTALKLLLLGITTPE